MSVEMAGKYFLIAFAVILVVEIVAGRHRGIWSRRELTLAGSVILINNFVTRPLAALLVAKATLILFPDGAGSLSGVPTWLGYIAVLVAHEFCFYWVHRWSHEGKGRRHEWLWKLHRTHHSAAYMNVVLNFRQNIFWQFLVPAPWVFGLAIYFGQDKAAAFTILTIGGWNLLTHSNFRWDDWVRNRPYVGRAFWMLEHILVSPGVHHTHHGYGKDGANYRNYAVTLAVFDWMFGTLHIPKGRPWRYGVPGKTASLGEEAFFPIVRDRKPAPES